MIYLKQGFCIPSSVLESPVLLFPFIFSSLYPLCLQLNTYQSTPPIIFSRGTNMSDIHVLVVFNVFPSLSLLHLFILNV